MVRRTFEVRTDYHIVQPWVISDELYGVVTSKDGNEVSVLGQDGTTRVLNLNSPLKGRRKQYAGDRRFEFYAATFSWALKRNLTRVVLKSTADSESASYFFNQLNGRQVYGSIQIGGIEGRKADYFVWISGQDMTLYNPLAVGNEYEMVKLSDVSAADFILFD